MKFDIYLFLYFLSLRLSRSTSHMYLLKKFFAIIKSSLLFHGAKIRTVTEKMWQWEIILQL